MPITPYTGSLFHAESHVLPTTTDLDGNAPELSPQARCVTEGTVLSLVAGTACTVSLSYFAGMAR